MPCLVHANALSLLSTKLHGIAWDLSTDRFRVSSEKWLVELVMLILVQRYPRPHQIADFFPEVCGEKKLEQKGHMLYHGAKT